MHITNVMTKLDDFIHQAKIELSCGNEFQARRQLVNIRELLMNELPLGEPAEHEMTEEHAWNSYVKIRAARQEKREAAKTSEASTIWEHLH